ncbi:MAG: hypothetical protein PHQ19_08365 [Candidatus Krumholzibacteria bacterium]|nr:hypothetical protein [Candidatus Krumholzibacteria bacterium]
MDEKKRFRLEMIALCCAIVMVLVTALPMLGRYSDAQILGLSAGAFGAGAMFTNLVRGRAERRRRP